MCSPIYAVLVEAESAGRLMFYGQGAGGAPTASAVLFDVVAAAAHRVHGGWAPREFCYADLPILGPESAITRYQIQLRVDDKSGSLAALAGAFAVNDVSNGKTQSFSVPLTLRSAYDLPNCLSGGRTRKIYFDLSYRNDGLFPSFYGAAEIYE